MLHFVKQHLQVLLLAICFPFLISNALNAQTGAPGNPFTLLSQSLGVPSAGIYYFNLGGTTFDTYVDASGYVLVAIDFGTNVGAMPQSTSVTTAASGILNPTVLATLGSATEVRISSSNGLVDAVSTDATLLTRVTANSTLHRGVPDNGINNGWTGTNSVMFTSNSTCTTTAPTTLNNKVFHPCGNVAMFHWQSIINQHRQPWSATEVAPTVSFRLWIRDGGVVPIELLEFDASPDKEAFDVNLTWQTATEINNDFFVVERSTDASNWAEVLTKDGAGNSSSILNYVDIDENPFYGLSYYRLKQVDFNGSFSYSHIEVVSLEKLQFMIVYPNPSDGHFTFQISSSKDEKIHFEVYDNLGRLIRNEFLVVDEGINYVSRNLTELASGKYHVRISGMDRSYGDNTIVVIREN